MNKRIKRNLLRFIKTNKSICVNICNFSDILKDKDFTENIDIISDAIILKSGLFAILDNTKIFVSRTVEPGYIKVSELESPQPNSKDGWSIQFDLNSTKKEMDRLLDLIAFW